MSYLAITTPPQLEDATGDNRETSRILTEITFDDEPPRQMAQHDPRATCVYGEQTVNAVWGSRWGCRNEAWFLVSKGEFTMDMLFRMPGNCAHRDGMSLQTTITNLLMSLMPSWAGENDIHLRVVV